MILFAYGQPAPTVTELLKLPVRNDVFTPQGALHAGLADLATSFGIPGRAEPIAAVDLVRRISDAPMIMLSRHQPHLTNASKGDGVQPA
ncbi:hypothetical protein OG394_29195 [Kribbella sp. NBC_01245]|uniref:hypothetical protein n=1 Tax=Kribbella sp. NBC_01245 TaxID=2903578 RepID=UPI002E2CFEA7|nr:hypothetical protein [Kribbella sp. NBC_01245]